jgi:hypothetical protein
MRHVVALPLALLAPLAFSSGARAEPDTAWVGRMDALAVAITDLLPLLEKDRSWDVAKEERVRADLRTLHGVAHDLGTVAAPPGGPAQKSKLPDRDPTIPLLVRELNRALDSAEKAKGDKLRADAHLVVATCIGCHTRSDLGAPKPRTSLPAPKNLEPWLRADVLLATRRFADARTTYKDVVFDEALAHKEPTLWERAVKRALVVEVRTARDPKRALELVERVLNTPAGEPLWADAAEWQRDLKTWAKEPPASDDTQELYRLASRLMDEASLKERPPGDSGSDILYLRATGHLHALLARTLDAPMRAQAVAWLAIAYEALRDLDVWSLFLLYNEACIEAAPHSSLAKECFERWERNTLIEETGNSGAPLPADKSERRKRLKALASAAAPAPPAPAVPSTQSPAAPPATQRR